MSRGALQVIHKDTSLEKTNFRRLAHIGWTLVGGLVFALVGSTPCIGQERGVIEEKTAPLESLINTRGKEIYLRYCADCHGAQGEGSDEYAERLQGEWTIAQLSDYISPSMPPDEPELCVGEEAQLVAAFIHGEFYGPQSRLRQQTRPADFSRLTVRQFQEMLADLSVGLASSPKLPPERGLQASYFAARNRTEERKLAAQVEPTLNFVDGVPYFDPTGDYPTLKKPEKPPENKMNDGFSAYWSGSLIAPVTGTYRILVRSQNGFQLRLNSSQQPLIDRKVRSDDVWDHEAFIFLLAGRAYPLQIDFFSYPQPPARFELMWQPPQGVTEIVPAEFLVPMMTPESLAIKTPFPPDDSSTGYERGISVSREWDEAVTSAALEAADWFSERIHRLAGTKATDSDRIEKIQAWSTRMIESVFGSSMTEQERYFYVQQHFEMPLSVREQVQQMVVLLIKSPRFLYPSLANSEVSMQTSRSLALTLWDSLPDEQSLQRAKDNHFDQPEALQAEIERMIADPKAKAKLQTFFEDWLQLDRDRSLVKDRERFPEFDDQLRVDLQRSFDQFLDHIVWSDQGDFRQLFLTNLLPMNRRLANYYQIAGDTAPVDGNFEHDFTDTKFVFVPLDERYWCGILTHPYLMTRLAYHRQSSPIHRGVFVTRQLLGRSLRQPTENFEPLTEAFDPSMTNRQRVEYQTKDSSCMGCHQLINPLGFSLENFDATGRFRTREGEQEINTQSVYQTIGGREVAIHGPQDLARLIADDVGAQQNFIRQLFSRYTKQPIEVLGPDKLSAIHQRWVEQGLKFQPLIGQIAQIHAQYEKNRVQSPLKDGENND